MKMKDIKGLKNIRESFKTRQVKYGGYAALITIAVIVGLILINLIIGQLSPQIDMTESGLFSLSDQSTQVVDLIKSPVNFYGMWRPGDENQQLTEVIDLYLARNKNIRLQVVDPNKNPALVSKYDKTNQGIQPGSLIVEGEKGFKIIAPSDMYDYTTNQNNQQNVTGLAMERRITAALLFVATGQTPVVYEILGHQEYTLNDLQVQTLVERENFTVNQLNLVQSDIPSDASVLILNAPRADLSQGEADKILAYLDNGGRLLILADYRIRELPVLNQIMASYGMQFDFGLLMETNTNYTAGAYYLEIPDVPDHDITKPLTDQRTPVLLPFAMGVSQLSAVRRSIELKPLFTSSSDSFLRTNLDETSTSKVSTDVSGPITLGMTAMDPSWIDPNNPQPQARVVAIGCGSLLEPVSYFGQIPGNLDVFMNSVTWLQDRPETLSVRSKSLFLLPMRINGTLMIIYGIFFVIIIPVGFFIAGFIVWLRRRHL
ncbi:MAG: GldG family protein [Treponema sp.]|nr:GldG family protein [Treponema sp.]